jgi:hypothetical protein
MTSLGLRLAKPPVSPHANLVAVERIGANKQGSAIWRLACTCGKVLESDAYKIRQGGAHCPDCNPRYADQQAKKVLDVLPATIDEIVAKTGMTLYQVKFRVGQMEPTQCHTGRWKRAGSEGGSHQPIIVAGPGPDVPCPFRARTPAETSRRYRKRVKKAIEKALITGKAPVRYVRLVARRQADEMAARTRVAPQTWASVLGL